MPDEGGQRDSVDMLQPTPLLTIAIPTYNRAEKLAQLLDSIFVESKLLSWPIEILVSDNASTDDTPRIANGYVSRGLIRFRRNSTNIGFDRNVAAVIGCARGEFVWLMGDDDRVAPGFLPRLGSILRSETVDFVIACDVREDRPLENNLARFFGVTESVRGPLKEFLLRHGVFGILFAMGHAIFRRTAAEGFERVAAQRTAFGHVFVLARCFAERPTLFLIDSAFITPVMTRAERTSYWRRLVAEGLYDEAWCNCLPPFMELVDTGVFASPVPQNVFRMNYHQNWPLHFHVYLALARKVRLNRSIADAEWALFRRFDDLLGEPSYTSVLGRISKASRMRSSIARALLTFIPGPAAVPYPAAPNWKRWAPEILDTCLRELWARRHRYLPVPSVRHSG